jgi:adenylate cyclase
MADLSPAEFESLGLYDPNQPDAAPRLALLEYLVSVGATADDLVTYRNELPGLASVVAIRAGDALTPAQAAERAGMSIQKLLQLRRAAGFAEPGPDDRAITEQFVALASDMAAAEAVFGEEAVLALVRVMGSSMARLADAIVSAFLVNVEASLRDHDPAGLNVAQANAQAVALLPSVNAGLDALLRQHILAARRSILEEAAETGYETRTMCVGFIDLVGSTALAHRLSIGELGRVLTMFELAASDAVTTRGGRVVKLIGDEVLYTAPDATSACAIALDLTARFAEHPSVPPVRAGIAGGEVLIRDGDVFGPVVNLAARLVKLAPPGQVLATRSLATGASLASMPLRPQQLKGFDDDVELCQVLAA